MGTTSYDIGWSFISSRGCPDMELSTGLHHGNTLAYRQIILCCAEEWRLNVFTYFLTPTKRTTHVTFLTLSRVTVALSGCVGSNQNAESTRKSVESRNKKVESKIPTHLPVFRVARTHCLFHMLRQLSRLSCLSVWKSVLTNFNPKYM